MRLYKFARLVHPYMIQQNPTINRETNNSVSTLGNCSVTLTCREPQTEVSYYNFENLGRAAVWKCNPDSQGLDDRGVTAYYKGVKSVPRTVWDVRSIGNPYVNPSSMLPSSRFYSVRTPALEAKYQC
jgi:hypothetical protein